MGVHFNALFERNSITSLNPESKVQHKLCLLAPGRPASFTVVVCHEGTLMTKARGVSSSGMSGVGKQPITPWGSQQGTTLSPKSSRGVARGSSLSSDWGTVMAQPALPSSSSLPPPSCHCPSFSSDLYSSSSLAHSFLFSNCPSVHVTHVLGNWSPSAVWVPLWKDVSALPGALGAANFSEGFICQPRRLT